MKAVARRRPSGVATIASAWRAAVRSSSCMSVKYVSVAWNVASSPAQPPAGARATTEVARPRSASWSAT